MQTDFDNFLAAQLDPWRADGLDRQFRVVSSASGPRIRIGEREFLNFSSNDYLGLASDPLLKRATADAIEKFGVGATASRLVCGNFTPYAALEEKLARFKHKQAAIVFGNGYAANVGAISALVGEGDTIIADKLCHASIIDGARMSGATLRIYPHQNLDRLEELLVGAISNRDPKTASKVLMITETVFSMDGDLAPLREIVALKEKHGAWLMIDEAHATGLYAPHRRGIAEAMGVEDKIEITLGTLSKSLGAQGGYVVGSQTLIDFLRNKARALIYSTAMPPAIVAAAAAAVDFVMSDAGHERRDQLWRNVSDMKNGLSALGVRNESRSPIIPIIIGGESAAVEISQKLYQQGVFVPAIRYPTVPKGKARLRVTVTAAHTFEDIENFLKAMKNILVGATFLSRPFLKAMKNILVGATFLSRPADVTESPAASNPSDAPTPTNRDRNVAPAKPHQSALRRERCSLSDRAYFITTCTEERRPIFKNPEAARVVINALRWLRDRKRIRLLGFVIMPDHIHAAFSLRSEDESRGRSDIPVATLDEVMKSLKGFTSREIHQRFNVPSPVWQTGYRDHMLRDRRDFQAKLNYMHKNPVRAEMVEFMDDYPFSTAHPDYQNEIDWAWIEGFAA